MQHPHSKSFLELWKHLFLCSSLSAPHVSSSILSLLLFLFVSALFCSCLTGLSRPFNVSTANNGFFVPVYHVSPHTFLFHVLLKLLQYTRASFHDTLYLFLYFFDILFDCFDSCWSSGACGRRFRPSADRLTLPLILLLCVIAIVLHPLILWYFSGIKYGVLDLKQLLFSGGIVVGVNCVNNQ